MNKIKFLGTDTSFYVEEIDYDKMVSAGAKFTMIRAGQGGWIDTRFVENQAKSKGKLPRGSYWFFDDRYSPKSQAELYREALGGDTMECPLVVDYERSYGGQYAGWAKLSAMILILEGMFPEKEIMIYTRANYFDENSPPDGTAQKEWFKQYKLWVAAYNDRPIDSQAIPDPWDRFHVWQFSADTNTRGSEFGVSSVAIDLNYFYGTEYEFGEFTGGFIYDDPPDTPDETKYLGEVVYSGGVNFRTGAGIQYPKKSDAKPFGTKVLVDEVLPLGTEIWIHVIKVDGIAEDGWMASYWNGFQLISLEEIVTDPPPPPTTDIFLESVYGVRPDGNLDEIDIYDYDGVRVDLSDGTNTTNLFDLSDEPNDDPDPIDISGRLPYPWDDMLVPDDGDFKFCLHDFQTSEWGYRPRSHAINLDYRKDPPTNALPEMIKTIGCKPNDFLALNESFQWLWFEMLVRAAGGVLTFNGTRDSQIGKIRNPVVTGGYMTLNQLLFDAAIGWPNLVANHRSFTDGHSANESGYIDYVLGMQINDKYPDDLKGDMMQKCLSSGGNIVKVKRHLGRLSEVYAIDPTGTVPHIDEIWDKPWLIHWATQETMTLLAPNIWRVSPYPQVRINGAKTGTPFMFLGIGGVNLIENHRLVSVPNGKSYSPYIRHV